MRVLIAEDDPVSRHMLEGMLDKWGYEVESAWDGGQAWDLLCVDDPARLVILDWAMPVLDGLEVCERIRTHQNGHYTYVLLLTIRGRKEDVVKGLDAGADDYVTKPFDAEELRMRLEAAGRVLNLQSELLEAREALQQEATHDHLTGLKNRPAILEVLHKELNRGLRTNSSVGILLGDLDRFKAINDQFGHKAGDIALQEVSRRMSSVLREYDAVGRYGGEEFLVVLPGCDARRSAELAERLCRQVAAEPVIVGDQSVMITCSLGAVATADSPNADMDVLVNAADAAMYSAKRAGGNRVTVGSVGQLIF